jgi:hypothetical protein
MYVHPGRLLVLPWKVALRCLLLLFAKKIRKVKYNYIRSASSPSPLSIFFVVLSSHFPCVCFCEVFFVAAAACFSQRRFIPSAGLESFLSCSCLWLSHMFRFLVFVLRVRTLLLSLWLGGALFARVEEKWRRLGCAGIKGGERSRWYCARE